MRWLWLNKLRGGGESTAATADVEPRIWTAVRTTTKVGGPLFDRSCFGTVDRSHMPLGHVAMECSEPSTVTFWAPLRSPELEKAWFAGKEHLRRRMKREWFPGESITIYSSAAMNGSKAAKNQVAEVKCRCSAFCKVAMRGDSNPVNNLLRHLSLPRHTQQFPVNGPASGMTSVNGSTSGGVTKPSSSLCAGVIHCIILCHVRCPLLTVYRVCLLDSSPPCRDDQRQWSYKWGRSEILFPIVRRCDSLHDE
jgi:hypothetical protein